MTQRGQNSSTNFMLSSNSSGNGVFATFDSTLTWLPFQFYLNSTEVMNLKKSFESVSIDINSSQKLQHDIQSQWIQQGVVPQIQVVLHNGGQIQPINPNSSYFTAFCGTLVRIFHLLIPIRD